MDQAAVAQLHAPGQRGGDLAVVGDHEHGRALAVERPQQLEDLAAGARVEVAGGLIGEHDRRRADERARDRHALALAPGQQRRGLAHAVAEPDAVERRGRRPAALAGGGAGVEQAVGDVLQRAVGLQQVELLEDEADATRPERRQVAVGGAGDVGPGDPHEPAGRPFQGAHDVQQRRLARARRADDRAQLAVLHGQVDAAQRLHAAVVALDDVRQLKDGAHCDSITVMPSCTPAPSTWT